MKIPKRLTLDEFRIFIFEIAKRFNIVLKNVEFHHEPLIVNGREEAKGAAYSWGAIALYLPLRKKYNPKPFLPTILHELGHLYLLQKKGIWGHAGLAPVVKMFCKTLGWSFHKITSGIEERYDEAKARQEYQELAKLEKELKKIPLKYHST